MVFSITRMWNEGENLIQKNENDKYWFCPTKMMKTVNVIWVQKKRERIRNVLVFFVRQKLFFRIIRSRSNRSRQFFTGTVRTEDSSREREHRGTSYGRTRLPVPYSTVRYVVRYHGQLNTSGLSPAQCASPARNSDANPGEHRVRYGTVQYVLYCM